MIWLYLVLMNKNKKDNQIMYKANDKYEKFLQISIGLTAEKNYNKLLEKIVKSAREITNSDGGTLYICESNQLVYKILQNKSLNIFTGGDGKKVNIPALEMVESNVSTYAAINNKIINIEDVYQTDLFDFSGPKNFDRGVGYHTKSMLVIPICDRMNKVIGILQLINCKGEDGNIKKFDESYEHIIMALASQAGILVSNVNYLEETKNFLNSFVKVLSAGIDARTPYNAYHSKNVARLAEKFAYYLDEERIKNNQKVVFGEKRIKELVLAAWLHDVGKIAIPVEVMDKSTRLGNEIEFVITKVDYIISQIETKYYKKIIENAENKSACLEKIIKEKSFYKEVKEVIIKANNPANFITDETIEKLHKIDEHTCKLTGEKFFTEKELINLSIRKGTLNPEERKIMESHVKITDMLLKKITFPQEYEHVSGWASRHHEFLDGTGYMLGLKGEHLDIEVRILTILDIYDALIAERPYKKRIQQDKVFIILKNMALEGKLDIDLLESFITSKVYE